MNESHRGRAEQRSAETESARGSPWLSHRCRRVERSRTRKEWRKLSATRSYNALLPQWRGPHGETSALKTPRAWSGEIKPRVRPWWGWKQRVISASRDAPLTAADATLHSTRRVMKSTCTWANLENSMKLVNCEISETKIPRADAFTANDTGGSNTVLTGAQNFG